MPVRWESAGRTGSALCSPPSGRTTCVLSDEPEALLTRSLAQSTFSSASAPEASALEGVSSTFRIFTTPSSTSME